MALPLGYRTMLPRRISILGVGLLGGSIGLAAKAHVAGCVVTGYGHRSETLQIALETGAIDEASTKPAEAVRGCDLAILCTPVGVFNHVLADIAPHLADGAVVTDVGSTKRSVVSLAERRLPPSVHFVGSHPMAGSEKRGVEFARTDLFQNALCIVTPTARTRPEALGVVEAFWKAIGMRLTRLSPEAHDAYVADVSHLPHAVAAALVAMQGEPALKLAGKGFLDTTRIAGGDGALWRDIFLDNRDNVRASLQRLREQLAHFEQLLEEGRDEELVQWLSQHARRREELMRQKLREIEE